jgi:hypothetical protein
LPITIPSGVTITVSDKNLVTVKGEMGYDSTQIQTANNDGISKGSAVISKSRYDLENGVVNSSGAEASDNFCRSWTTLDRYDSIANLIRNKPLYSDPDVAYRFQTKGSVLDGPFVKIAPYSNDLETDPKKFMFSIENLAWKDNFEELPPCEQGPGDKAEGEGGIQSICMETGFQVRQNPGMVECNI